MQYLACKKLTITNRVWCKYNPITKLKSASKQDIMYALTIFSRLPSNLCYATILALEGWKCQTRLQVHPIYCTAADGKMARWFFKGLIPHFWKISHFNYYILWRMFQNLFQSLKQFCSTMVVLLAKSVTIMKDILRDLWMKISWRMIVFRSYHCHSLTNILQSHSEWASV